MRLLRRGKEIDLAHTRVGLRKIYIDSEVYIYLNGNKLFQRLVLDQGYWQDSGLTPPSAEALKKDIEISKAMGFNGARKHQKFEDPYFYYYAEELGFLTWCEMPSAYTFCASEVKTVTKEWMDIVREARNFTSVIPYAPLNESWGAREMKTRKGQQNFARSLYYLTKSIDSTRLVSTNDGFENIDDSDILSIHDYHIKFAAEFPVKYKNGEYDGLNPQGWALFADGNKYKGQPVLLTEFGGLAFANAKEGEAWGYGMEAKNNEEFYERFVQLTDAQQEVNGLLNADHSPKLDTEKLKSIFENT